MVTPILMVVSETPSVSDQPAAHFVRSTVQPSGPVSVLPSADLPQWLSLMRLMIASRCLVHTAAQSASEVGVGPAVVEVVAAPVAVVDDAAEPPAVVAVEDPSLSSPPQAAPTS